MKKFIIASLTAALTLALAGCPSGYGKGDSGRPMPAPSYSSIFGNSTSGATPEAGASTYVSIFDTPTAPVAKADAAGAPGLYECHDTLIPASTGLRVNVTLKPRPMIQGQLDIRCDIPPRVHVTTMVISKAVGGDTNPAPGSGLWRSVSSVVHGNLPGPVTTSYYIYTSCQPGWYFLSYTVSGITGDQVPRTFGPNSPTGPQMMIGAKYYVSGDECP